MAAAAAFGLVESAVTLLGEHPLIERPGESGLRELVISRGKTVIWPYIASTKHTAAFLCWP